MYLSIAFRNIFRNPGRSVLSAIAILLSVLGIYFMFGFIIGFTDNLRDNVRNFITGDLRIRHHEFDTYEQLMPIHLTLETPAQLVSAIESLTEVSSVLPRIPFSGAAHIDGENEPIQVIGIDFGAEQTFLDFDSLLLSGTLPRANRPEVLAGVGFMDTYNFSVGDTVTIITTTKYRSANAFSVTIVGIAGFPYGQLNSNHVLLPLSQAQRYLLMGDDVTEILIKTTSPNSLLSTKQAIKRLPQFDSTTMSLKSWRDIGSWYSIIRLSYVSYTIMALIFFILSSTVIVNTTLMVIFERKHEIGMLGAIGMNPHNIVGMFYIESLLVALIGGAIGIVFGAVLIGILGHTGLDLSSQLSSIDFEVGNIIYPRSTAWLPFAILAYAVVIAAIATLLPTLKIVRMNIVDALRSR